jgi:hypothetical protein
MCKNKICNAVLYVVLVVSPIMLWSCNNSQLRNDDCLNGLSASQKASICKFAAYLKDTSKIDAESTLGLPEFTSKTGIHDFTNSITVSRYAENYLDNFFHILDLAPVDTSDANRYYKNYVRDKCHYLETSRPTSSGIETKSVLVSIDSLSKLTDALNRYQTSTGRKTGVRVVFADYDNTSPTFGELTFFMVGTIDTMAHPLPVFDYRYQKDVTILGSSWGIPSWGLKAYNHGELCPNRCSTTNTDYNQ